MKRNYIWLALGGLVALGAALALPSCGHDQKVVSLTITPTTSTFPEPAFTPPPPNPTQQYSAIATYIHPPATKDVTSQATWTIDNGVATLTSPGVVSATLPPATAPPGTPGPCGVADISASIPEGTGGSGNVVIALASVTVNDPSNILCPGGGKLATLAVGVVGAGTVTSLPTAISCTATGGTCIAVYSVGASVLLTASQLPVVWANCPGSSGTTCVVTIPTGGAAVSATFQ
ncbi:MAG TPA: hypothetical protein VKR59_07580 [Terriglobales bacterium]|nr:hypothetical protein [Terriglobales bacterium]